MPPNMDDTVAHGIAVGVADMDQGGGVDNDHVGGPRAHVVEELGHSNDVYKDHTPADDDQRTYS